MLLLASQSPRRKAILRFAGVPFKVFKPKGVLEVPAPHESAMAYASRLALEKALAVAWRQPRSWVLGADTIVSLQGKIIEKPKDQADAKKILMRLRGRIHEVMTGVALVAPGNRKIFRHLEKTKVHFGVFQAGEIRDYLKTKEPYDKAGAYDIRGTAKKWIEGWDGDYFNILGLPAGWVLDKARRFLER